MDASANGAGCDSADEFCDSLLHVDPSVQRVSQLSDAEARRQLAKSNANALVILNVAKDWKAASWSIKNLADRFGNAHVRVGLRPEGQSKTMPLLDFAHYVERRSDGDLNPCYVFEPRVRAPLTEEYDATIGGLFPHDLLGLLDDTRRPPYRWLCLGPKRSGSPPHIDPLATSAWNALFSGWKRWAFVDPKAVGTLLERQKVEAGKLSPLEWFRDRLPWIRRQCPSAVYEIVQQPGDVIFVPAGMWHAVLNLTDTVAITQNFIGHNEFDKAWRAVRRERPGLACEWFRLLEMHESRHSARAQELDALDGVSTTSLSPERRTTSASSTSNEDDGLIEWLLLQRLQSKRHFQATDARFNGLPKWSDAASYNSSSRWSATIARSPGNIFFVSCALSCVYADEARDSPIATALAKKFSSVSEAQQLVSQWGLSRTSSAEEVSQAFSKASQEVWCFRTAWSGEVDKCIQKARVNGLALFPFSGVLRHSWEPNLVLTFVGNACIAIASKDIAIGDELTVCLTPFRFCDAQELSKRRTEKDGLWPTSLPPKDQPQFSAALTFLTQMEKAAWDEDNLQEQRIAAGMLKKWILDCGDTRLLNSYPYLRFRANALLLHLCLGTHLLDDAWDAAVVVLALLAHVPLQEATELCVSLALLGGALAYQLQQPTRALELFRGGEHILMQALGGGAGVWKAWLASFVPQPLLRASLSAWERTDHVSTECLPGLGVWEERSDIVPEECTNMERWKAAKDGADMLISATFTVPSEGQQQSDPSQEFNLHSEPQAAIVQHEAAETASVSLQLDDMD